MTGPKIFTPEYYQRMRELEAGSWWNAGMRDAAARLLAKARLPTRGRVLDAGCGSGQTIDWFRSAWPGWESIGVDVARDGLTFFPTDVNAMACAGSVLSLPLRTDSVDLILCFDVLQHLPLDDGAVVALTEFRRVLKPGGWLLVRTNAQAWPRIPNDHTYAFHKYTPAELRSQLSGVGFRVHRLGRINSLLGLAEIPRELRAQRGRPRGYAGLLSSVPRPGIFWHLKRRWLGVEGRILEAGGSLPLGRSLVALAHSWENSAMTTSSLPPAFLPLHKRALGVALGTVLALLVFGLTVDSILRASAPRDLVGLLAGYFTGYTISWSGAAIGAAWALFTGFIFGWFWAFARNFALAAFILVVRTRANLANARDLLDHI